MRRFRARGNGLELSVLEWEAREPRATCVLLHGFMDAGESWDLVAPALADSGLRVIAPDLRGFGCSDRVSGGGYYHFPDYVADLDALARALVPEPFFLVGHSMGGTVATLFAGARPERVRKLAVLEGLGPPDHRAEDAPLRMTRWLEDLAGTARSEKSGGSGGEATRREDLSGSLATPELAEEDALRRLAAAHPRVPREVLASRLPLLADKRGGGWAWRYDPLHRTTSPMPFFADVYRAFAARVACPVLYVSGGALGWRVPDEAERLAAFAHATHVDLPDAGHMMHWTKPTELADALGTFWARR